MEVEAGGGGGDGGGGGWRPFTCSFFTSNSSHLAPSNAPRRHRLALRRELDVAVAGVGLLAVAARQVAVDHAAVALAQAAQRVDVDALLVEVDEQLAAPSGPKRLLQPLGLAGGELGHHAGAAARHLRRLRQLARQLFETRTMFTASGLPPPPGVPRTSPCRRCAPDARRRRLCTKRRGPRTAQEAEVARPVGDGAREHLRRAGPSGF